INFFFVEKDYLDAPSYKFFYEVKGKMSEGLSPSLFPVLSNPKIEYNIAINRSFKWVATGMRHPTARAG
ncbi:hypothetical protein HOK09_02250, partial [Candidatus Woesearchaeota archaeon]|nr:hypothetical protein [Candidatus Woesearchaeota archaeon]